MPFNGFSQLYGCEKGHAINTKIDAALEAPIEPLIDCLADLAEAYAKTVVERVLAEHGIPDSTHGMFEQAINNLNYEIANNENIPLGIRKAIVETIRNIATELESKAPNVIL